MIDLHFVVLTDNPEILYNVHINMGFYLNIKKELLCLRHQQFNIMGTMTDSIYANMT